MSRKGFTLIELLVVVAVLALLASIVFSNLGGAREGARISNALSFQSQTHSLLGSDLVGWWNFNEGSGTTTRDISGYDNHGNIIGATYVEGVPGTGGTALSFNGVDNYVWLPSVNPTDAITVAAWVKSAHSTGYSASWQIVSKYEAYILGTGSAGSRSMSFIISIPGSGWQYGPSYNVPDPDNWHYFVGTYDSRTGLRALHVDGVLRDTRTSEGTINPDTGPINLAQRECCPGQVFNGLIDDVRIYSRALTSQEVQTLYAQTKDNYLADK